MKYYFLYLILSILPFTSSGQIYLDTLKKTSLPIMVNTHNDLKEVKLNIGRATDNYITSDILFLSSIGLGILAVTSNQSNVPQGVQKGLYVLSAMLNGVGWVIRFEGHSEMKEVTKNLDSK